MQAHSTYPAEYDCTCGYLPMENQYFAAQTNSDLTYQIGSLLIALGGIFSTVPMFKIHISQSTANLLISIGTKLTRSVKKSTRMYS